VNGGIDTYLLLRAMIDEFVRCGMRHACTSPGSRNAPIALTLANEPRLSCHSHIDERCAGFFALGIAKASGLPVAVTCTSGTAAAQLLPAAIEAHEARVPLLLLTADRPSELREVGAGQSIDQLKLYGSAAKWFFEVAPPDASEASLRWMRTLACRAYWTALQGRPGVVHLNLPLREPLVVDEPLPSDQTGRPDGKPYVRRVHPTLTPMSASGSEQRRLRELVGGRRKGVVVAGRWERDCNAGIDRSQPSGASAGETTVGDAGAGSPLADAAARFCEAAGWPLLADPLSRARRGDAAIAHYDALLRDERFMQAMRPEVVLRVGDLPVCKPLRRWLGGMSDVSQVALDPEGAWQDPASVICESLVLDPVAALQELRDAVVEGSAAEEWLQTWRGADEHAGEAIQAVLGSELSEPVLARELGVLLPENATLFVASSMPVREIESFWPVREDPPRVLCNRGANGIDGIVSSAFGVAAARQGPVVLLIGDVALAHDIGGLLAAGRLELSLTIVLVDNAGGGIFDFLPVASAPIGREPGGSAAPSEDRAAAQDLYTRHIATPTGLDFAHAASLYGLQHERVNDLASLRAALERGIASSHSSIVEIRGEREANVALHESVWSRIAAAISAG
jgi:2-succinyl-5-enolpyruvyl-6-hydroxy-3-cyclohexene-1-carboxylate synthase